MTPSNWNEAFFLSQTGVMREEGRTGRALMLWLDENREYGWFVATDFRWGSFGSPTFWYVAIEERIDPEEFSEKTIHRFKILHAGRLKMHTNGKITFESESGVEPYSMRDIVAFEVMWPRLMDYVDAHRRDREKEFRTAARRR